VAEGDTIHRIARRLEKALGGRVIEVAEAPSVRSPVGRRAGELRGRTLEEVAARGKHLLATFSGGLGLHSHLGIDGRWSVRVGPSAPRGQPWIRLRSGDVVAAQFGGKLLEIESVARIRNEPSLLRLGPDPLAEGFDAEAAATRLLALEPSREVGEALLDQRVIAGIGNAIRAEALFRARISPWRRLGDFDRAEAVAVVTHAREVMESAYASGRRPRSVYRRPREPCPVCGTPIRSRGQGDANRIAYWCPRCQNLEAAASGRSRAR
jgi:endonuclease VIII